MTLYNIIYSLQQEPSTNGKLAILETNKENTLLQEYLRVTLSPQINFYVSEKTFPNATKGLDSFYNDLTQSHINSAIYLYAERKLTGNHATRSIADALGNLCPEAQELLKMMLLKDIKAGIGAKQINKVWPNLIPVQPYMRCSLPSEVDTSAWDWKSGVYSQVKADGMYCAISNDRAITRNGNCFDINSFPKGLQAAIKAIPDGVELNGELVVYVRGSDVAFDRKTSNGLLNSMLKSGEPLEERYKLNYFVWDYQADFDGGLLPYSHRYNTLFDYYIDPLRNIRLIETKLCYTQEQAQQHLKECLARGLEGTVLKNPKGLWKDGTSKDIVKNKIVADIDLLCYDVYEGSGKAKGKLGGLCLRSSDGIIKVNVGTGFTDAQRDEYWKYPPIGSIVHITVNDIVQDKKTMEYSLFLPSFQEVRTDKAVADDFQKVKAIINDAKGV